LLVLSPERGSRGSRRLVAVVEMVMRAVADREHCRIRLCDQELACQRIPGGAQRRAHQEGSVWPVVS
ncbi:MAG TPA: hypothetical protein VGG73_20725, partial [Vicinamibacterales bacterium]